MVTAGGFVICSPNLLNASEVDLHAFVLVGNHFHLLAQTRRGNLSQWMHWLLKQAAAGVVLGSERFVQRIRDRLAQRDARKTAAQKGRKEEEISGLRSLRRVPQEQQDRAACIVSEVAKHYGVPAGRILDAKAGRGLEARSAALVLVREKIKEWTYGQIGAYFGGATYAGVAQRIGRIYDAEQSGRGAPASLPALRNRCQDVKT